MLFVFVLLAIKHNKTYEDYDYVIRTFNEHFLKYRQTNKNILFSQKFYQKSIQLFESYPFEPIHKSNFYDKN